MTLVFFDTEFTELAPSARWISIGLISENGQREFYAEISDTWAEGDLSDFARAEVLPLLGPKSERISQAALAKRLAAWLAEFGEPVQLATDSKEWDWRWIRELWRDSKWPENLRPRPHVLLFDAAAGERFIGAVERAFADGKVRRHHALDDAKANRLGWLAAQGIKAAE